jgi:hypothetical protein
MTGKLVVGAENAHANSPVVPDRQQDVDDRVAPPIPAAVALVVDADQVEELRERERGVVAQSVGRAGEIRAVDVERELAAVERLLADAPAQGRCESRAQCLEVGHLPSASRWCWCA